MEKFEYYSYKLATYLKAPLLFAVFGTIPGSNDKLICCASNTEGVLFNTRSMDRDLISYFKTNELINNVECAMVGDKSIIFILLNQTEFEDLLTKQILLKTSVSRMISNIYGKIEADYIGRGKTSEPRGSSECPASSYTVSKPMFDDEEDEALQCAIKLSLLEAADHTPQQTSLSNDIKADYIGPGSMASEIPRGISECPASSPIVSEPTSDDEEGDEALQLAIALSFQQAAGDSQRQASMTTTTTSGMWPGGSRQQRSFTTSSSRPPSPV